jgi:hypothetical protein
VIANGNLFDAISNGFYHSRTLVPEHHRQWDREHLIPHNHVSVAHTSGRNSNQDFIASGRTNLDLSLFETLIRESHDSPMRSAMFHYEIRSFLDRRSVC